MRNLLLFPLLFFVYDAISQEHPDSTFMFSGYIFDVDSIPIEGAYLINCRTLKAVSTDNYGYFRMRVTNGDSLVINHISYMRKFVFGNSEIANKNKYYLDFRPYELSPVIVRNYEMDLANFEKNMKFIYKEIGMMDKPVDYKTGSSPLTANPYAPGASAPGFGFNLLDLFPRKKKR